MTNQRMKNCIPLAIMKLQIKTIMRFHYIIEQYRNSIRTAKIEVLKQYLDKTSISIAKIKKTYNINC